MTTQTMSHDEIDQVQPDPAAWISTGDHTRFTSGAELAAALRAAADRLDNLGDAELTPIWMSLSLQVGRPGVADAEQARDRAGTVALVCQALGDQTVVETFSTDPDRVSFQNRLRGGVSVYDHFDRPSSDTEAIKPTAPVAVTPQVEHRTGMIGRNADRTVNGFCRCGEYFARYADHDALVAAITEHATAVS